MAGNDNGPWGSGGGKPGGGDKGSNNRDNNNNRGPDTPQMPEIDDLVKKGQEQLRVLMGGRGSGNGGGGGRASGGGGGINRGTIGLGLLGLVIVWAFMSFYRVDTSEQSVELLFGEYHQTGNEGLNFAPWPFVTKEILPVTNEQTEDIGVGGQGRNRDQGFMLTADENIADIDFQVVWTISNPEKFLFNLAQPRETIRAVSESVMREIVARTDLTPILTTGKAAISQELKVLIQETLDTYDSGVNIVRVNFDKADPPAKVADAFREVQAAEQTRDTLEKQALAYKNEKEAQARGEAAQIVTQAEGYKAQVVNQARGEASRFEAVLTEYEKAPDVVRSRLYLESMEQIMGQVPKIITNGGGGATGGGNSNITPHLLVNEYFKTNTRGAN